MHSIHGRAPAIATGLATSRADLSVWVVTGDGDALSIGGNHLIHALRRNVNMTILLFNNRIYGLTKGQYSPTSEPGKVTKSTPMGSVDHPFNPISLALGAEATFVARTIDSDRKHLTAVLSAAAAHRGTSFVEIYQNCPIFNDGAFDALKDNDTKADAIIPLVHGEPIRFGADGARPQGPGPRHHDGWGQGRRGRRRPRRGRPRTTLLVHDAHNADPTTAFAISRLTDAGYLHQAPIGIFRQVERPTYDDQARDQVATASGRLRGRPGRTAGGADRRRRHLDRRLSAAQSRQNSLPSTSCITRHDSFSSSASRSWNRVAPSGSNRAHSASSTATAPHPRARWRPARRGATGRDLALGHALEEQSRAHPCGITAREPAIPVLEEQLLKSSQLRSPPAAGMRRPPRTSSERRARCCAVEGDLELLDRRHRASLETRPGRRRAGFDA